MSQTLKEMEKELVNDNIRDSKNRESGGSSHYYSFPECTETKDIIRYKKMNHAEGEIMCALMRLHDNGEYKRNLEKIIYYAQSELEYLLNNSIELEYWSNVNKTNIS